MYLSCCLVEPRTLEHEYYCFNLFSQSQHNKHTLLRFVRVSFLTFPNKSSMYLLSFYSILFIRYRCQRNSIIRQCRLQNICSFKPLAQSFAQRRPEAGEPSNWIEIEINWLTPDPLLMLSLISDSWYCPNKTIIMEKICQWRDSFQKLKAVKAETLMNVVMMHLRIRHHHHTTVMLIPQTYMCIKTLKNICCWPEYFEKHF